MKQLSENYKSASYVLCGAASAVLPVLAASVFLLVLYMLDPGALYRSLPCLYLALFGLGYLIPPRMPDEFSNESGWESLVLLLLAVFCYTAVAVSWGRVGWGPVFRDQYRDMESLLRWLLSAAEPMMVILVTYFAARVSFSGEGLRLGGKQWFRTAAAVCALFVFLTSFPTVRFLPWPRWADVIRFLAQPVSACGIVVLVRALCKAVSSKRWEEVEWQDIFNL